MVAQTVPAAADQPGGLGVVARFAEQGGERPLAYPVAAGGDQDDNPAVADGGFVVLDGLFGLVEAAIQRAGHVGDDTVQRPFDIVTEDSAGGRGRCVQGGDGLAGGGGEYSLTGLDEIDCSYPARPAARGDKTRKHPFDALVDWISRQLGRRAVGAHRRGVIGLDVLI